MQKHTRLIFTETKHGYTRSFCKTVEDYITGCRVAHYDSEIFEDTNTPLDKDGNVIKITDIDFNAVFHQVLFDTLPIYDQLTLCIEADNKARGGSISVATLIPSRMAA